MEEENTLYAKWLSGELKEEELEALRKSGELEELERIDQLTSQLSLPKYDAKAGYARFKNRSQPAPAKVRHLRRPWLLGAAASIALLLIASLWFLNRSYNYQAAQAFAGANKKVELKEGSIVTLNDGSSMQFSQTWSGERRVELQGEAYFEVSKGEAFRVQTDLGVIEVLGTKFNVRAWGDQLKVLCFEGKVRVSQNGQEAVLEAGEGVKVAGGKWEQRAGEKEGKPEWMKGFSSFEEEALIEVFEEIERQFKVKIEGKDIKRSFSGQFGHDNLALALEQVCKPLGITYKLSEDKNTVYIDRSR